MRLSSLLTCQALLAAMLKVFASALLAYSRAEMYSRACCHHVCTLYMKVSRRAVTHRSSWQQGRMQCMQWWSASLQSLMPQAMQPAAASL